MTYGEFDLPEPLFDQVVRASGLATIIASVAVARACIRAHVDPKALTPESLVRVLPHLEQTLQLYLPSEAQRHISAIGSLATCKVSTMHVDLTLSLDDVTDLLGQFVPLEIELGPAGSGDRVVAVDKLTSVAFVRDAGVRIQCTGRLRWPVLGVGVPVHIQRLDVMLLPSVRSVEGHEELVFNLRVEDADIAWVPAVVDQSIRERVNRDLSEHHVELAWNFARTLSHVFQLPGALTTASSLEIDVTKGRIDVTEAALGMSVYFRVSVKRRPAPPASG